MEPIKKQMSNKEQGVLKTTDYSIFKGVIGNRGIHEPNIRRIRAALEKRNMLASNPIIVNERMEVLDGQHRLYAAKELGLPIYYTIVEAGGLEEIQMLNANNRPWYTYDYLDSYIAMGKKEYIRLKNFADEYRISIASALRIATGFQDPVEMRNDFKEGRFAFKDFEKADRLASLVAAVRDYSPDLAWIQRNCVRALAIVQDTLDDPKLLIDQLRRYNQVVTRRMSVKGYLEEFENILKANNPNAKNVSFTEKEREDN